MNYQEFVRLSEEHLVSCLWKRDGHNGVWPVFMKGTRCALPEALISELWASSSFDPIVELYLLDSGWRRSGAGVVVGQQIFVRGETYKTMRMALLEQLKIHRLDRATVAPPTTPEAMKKILDVTQFRQTPVSR